MNTTKEKIVAVFTEWNRRYLEDPENFSVATFDDSDAKVSANFFMSIHEELFPAAPTTWGQK